VVLTFSATFALGATEHLVYICLGTIRSTQQPSRKLLKNTVGRAHGAYACSGKERRGVVAELR
jgi:hypothetical protein